MKQLVFILSIILLTLYSCQEIIDIDTEFGNNFPRFMVVEGQITTDTTAHIVFLTWTKKIDDTNPPEKISGAHISISGNGQYIELTEKEPGIYATPIDFYGIPGNRYYLTIDNIDTDNDGEPNLITASDSIIAVPHLDSITLGWIEQWEAWNIKLYAQEPGNTENYYIFKAYVNDTLVSDTLNEYVITNDFFINGTYINGLDVYYFNEEDPDEYLYDGDKVTLSIESLTEEAFNFLRQARIESSSSIPLFSGPAANVHNNLEGENVFGFFMATDISKSSRIWHDSN